MSARRMIVVGCQVMSASLRLSDTRYFWTLFIQSAKGSPARSGQAPAMPRHVRVP